ncbi:MAG: hypothetical protein KA792_00600 [Bacteroidales bacterium]|nr:hypothetical protein [Bacteroidales bacterium]
MTKNARILVIVLVLAFITFYLVFNNSKSTLLKRYSNFALEDTASITKIFLADKRNNKVLLERIKPGKWTINKVYEGNNDAITILLKTIANINVRMPVSKTAHNNVIARMSAIAVKVEIYKTAYRVNFFELIKLFRYNKLAKVFYVGDNTKDNIGTYMLMEGSDQPFVTYIPGLRGFLSTRFVADENVWRSPVVFNFNFRDIKTVSIDFPETPDSSFTIDRIAQMQYKLYQANKEIPVYDTIKLVKFLSSFNNIRYEALLNDLDKHKKDSIINSKPYHILKLTDMNNNTIVVKTYHKAPAYGEYFDDAANEPVFNDKDRLYALINNDKDFVLIQFFVFEKILKTVNNFKYPY